MVYLDMLRKAMKKEQQEETAMDVQFQAMMQQFGMTGQSPEQAGQAPAPPPPGGMGAVPPQGPPGVNAAVVSSEAQGFPPAPPTEEPTQNVAPGQPRPGARRGPPEEEIGI